MASSIIRCGIFNCQIGRLENALELLSSREVNYTIESVNDRSSFHEHLPGVRVGTMATWPSEGSVEVLADGQIIIKLSDD